MRAYPLEFASIEKLRESLTGVTALYNTYWVRFNHKFFTFAQAVANSRVLFAAAREAGVKRIIHVSITNPSLNSPLEYFRGKAEVELALKESGVPYAILRPTVLFGKEDILKTFTYRKLVKTIGKAIGNIRPLMSVPPSAAYSMGLALGKAVHDVVITRDEIRGLMDGLLCVSSEPAGRTSLTEWASEHGAELGVTYASELARRKMQAN